MAPVPPPQTIGVVGAGTMGAGIAELACLAGARTLLHDPVPDALARGIEHIRGRLDRAVEHGRLSQAGAQAASARLEAAAGLGDLAGAELVIEAAPESLELKRALFSELSGVVAGDCVLATNTSSLLVTAIAAAARNPDRV